MADFVVSARKYRPARFRDVVGQSHVTNTLKNAFKSGQLAHAFLFTGPRGVGKTTCARIMAKVLNCEQVTADYEACDTCNSCKAFRENASFNVHELDAASNNSVEHIRALIEQVRFQPQQGKYKIYIIDEVHMLSTAAFNAFLKTLEEPPSYAKFILATTEKHKILPTILSRCQIFDFHRIQIADIQSHLAHICSEEHITAADDALHIIAQKADGGLRDALSIFDRMVSFCGNDIKYEDVIENLNILDYDYFFKLVDAMLLEEVPNVLLTYDKILRKGFDNEVFLNGLAAHLRNILISRDPITLQLLESGEAIKNRYLQQAQNTSMSFLLTALNICNDCDVRYGQARDKKLHLQMHLIKMCFISRGIQLAEQKKNNVAAKPVANAEAPKTTVAYPPPPPAKPLSFQESRELMAKKNSEEIKTPEPVTPKFAIKTETPVNEFNNQAKNDVKNDILATIKAETEAELQAQKNISQDNTTFFTLENLRKHWENYLETVESPTLKLILKEALPKLQLSEKTVNLTVERTLPKSQIEAETGLIELLRHELMAPFLAFNIEIKQSEEKPVQTPVANKAATQPTQNQRLSDPEKLRLMADENGLVRDFFKKFDLKIENS